MCTATINASSYVAKWGAKFRPPQHKVFLFEYHPQQDICVLTFFFKCFAAAQLARQLTRMSPTVECFCQSVTHRNSNRLSATQEKLFLFQGYPQICCSKLQLHLQKMYFFFNHGDPQESVLFLSHPQEIRIVSVYQQKGGFLKNHPQKSMKGLGL